MCQDGAVHVPGHGAAAAVPLHAVRVRGVVPAAAALVTAGAALRHRHTLPHHCGVRAMETHGGAVEFFNFNIESVDRKAAFLRL